MRLEPGQTAPASSRVPLRLAHLLLPLPPPQEMRERGIERNVHTFSALMNVCIKCGQYKLALDVYRDMRSLVCAGAQRGDAGGGRGRPATIRVLSLSSRNRTPVLCLCIPHELSQLSLLGARVRPPQPLTPSDPASACCRAALPTWSPTTRSSTSTARAGNGRRRWRVSARSRAVGRCCLLGWLVGLSTWGIEVESRGWKLWFREPVTLEAHCNSSRYISGKT